jgi:hypothetical protein
VWTSYATLCDRVKVSRRFEVSHCFHIEDPTVYDEDLALLYVKGCNHEQISFLG